MNRIHSTAIIGPEVQIGDGNVIGPYAVVIGKVLIGDGNWIGPNAIIGTPSQMRGYPHPTSWDGDECEVGIEIGNGNIVREFVTIHTGTTQITRIENGCYFMTQAHVPHDAQIENDVTLSNSVQIGGHTVVQNGANIGLGSVVHQRTVIGAKAMIGMGSVITKDVLPYGLVYGAPARLRGGNLVGMDRSGISTEFAQLIADALIDGNIEALNSLIPHEIQRFESAVLSLES
jgi:UDP-N-acetylglucosamine acyltransferase